MISGAYPFSSLQNALYMLFVSIRDVSPGALNLKLSLLLYYLLDLGFMPSGSIQELQHGG